MTPLVLALRPGSSAALAAAESTTSSTLWFVVLALALLAVALLIGTRISTTGDTVRAPARLDHGSIANLAPPGRLEITSNRCRVLARLPGSESMVVERADVAVVLFRHAFTHTFVTFEDDHARIVDPRRVRINRLQSARIANAFTQRGWNVVVGSGAGQNEMGSGERALPDHRRGPLHRHDEG